LKFLINFQLKKTKSEYRKSASAPERSQMKTEKDISKRHTWRLPKIVKSPPSLGKYVRSTEFSRIPVLPTITSTCSEKNAKATTTRQLCHIMSGSTSSIDR